MQVIDKCSIENACYWQIFSRKFKLPTYFIFRFVCIQTELSHLGHRKPSRIHWKADAPTVTVWCGFWSRGIIGPFFFENEQVNGDSYRAILNEFLFTKIWSRGYRQHLVSTGWRYVLHSRIYTRCFAPCFWRSYYQPQMSFDHRGAAIWHCWTIICGVPSKISVTPTSQRELTL